MSDRIRIGGILVPSDVKDLSVGISVTYWLQGDFSLSHTWRDRSRDQTFKGSSTNLGNYRKRLYK